MSLPQGVPLGRLTELHGSGAGANGTGLSKGLRRLGKTISFTDPTYKFKQKPARLTRFERILGEGW